MPTFLAIHNFGPGARERFAKGGPAMIALLKERYPQVVWNGAYIQWETGKAVCFWDAPDLDTIKGLFEQTQTPYQEIYPAEWFTPHDLATRA